MSGKTDPTDITKLEPTNVWQLFAGIAATPRPSKKERRIVEHVRAVAEQHGLTVREDSAGNLVIGVPATSGYEKAPITVLQGHLDMVCVQNSGTGHDFENEPIGLKIVEDPAGGGLVVRADGTTLGADNGIGVAMALAAALSPDVVHGPLELLCTVDEEEGMTGAKELGPQSFRGRRMLNLDSEEDDVLYIGCAGGCDATLSWEFALAPASGDVESCRIAVSGLRGGHSGGDIHENRGNAIRLLARALQRMDRDTLRVATINGGNLRNAIPREAEAVVSGPAGLRGALQTAAEQVRGEAVSESAEPNVKITVNQVAGTDVSALACRLGRRRRMLALWSWISRRSQPGRNR